MDTEEEGASNPQNPTAKKGKKRKKSQVETVIVRES
jgi:hypothetical protein